MIPAVSWRMWGRENTNGLRKTFGRQFHCPDGTEGYYVLIEGSAGGGKVSESRWNQLDLMMRLEKGGCQG